MINKPLIGILIICTGKYDIFLQPLIDSLASGFFLQNNVVIYLFYDKPYYKLNLPSRFSVVCTPTPHQGFPLTTLYRYKYFIGAEKKIITDYLFYLDVDMRLIGAVDAEILPGENDMGLVATGHPGFWVSGGAWCDNHNSTAFTQENNRTKYCAGGFQGGETAVYLAACKEMATNIEIDEKRGVMAEWHDEQHWNKYLSTRRYKLLTPEYCMVEEPDQQLKYGIANFTPKILALKKDHATIRAVNS